VSTLEGTLVVVSAEPRRRAAPTHFLNLDLDVAGAAAVIDELAEALDRRLLVLHRDTAGRRRAARYESRRQHATPDAALRAIAAVIEGLPARAKRAWRAATVRDFNVGVQAGRLPHAAEYAIAPATAGRIANLGARLVLTVYAPVPRPR
jgi:hypothetical protein